LILLIGAPILLVAMVTADYPFERIQGWYNAWFNPSQAPEDQLKLMWMLQEGRGSIADPAMWNVKASVTGLWNDYLFANIGADLYFPGTFLVVALYAWFGYRALHTALNAPDRFGALTATGLTVWILVQAAIHIGTSLTLIPTTGQPLPFMSYGGSSLLSCLAAAGLLVSISREQRDRKAAYAHFALGWGDWRPRLPHLNRGRRAQSNAGSDTKRYASQGQRSAAADRATRRTASARRKANSRAR
jgi:cell division protein FtsW